MFDNLLSSCTYQLPETELLKLKKPLDQFEVVN